MICGGAMGASLHDAEGTWNRNRTPRSSRGSVPLPVRAGLGCLAVALAWLAPALADGPPLCNQGFYWECYPSDGNWACDINMYKARADRYWCYNQSYMGIFNQLCVANGEVLNCTGFEVCLGVAEPEVCGDHKDNNYDGCSNEGCSLGKPPCTCLADCEQRNCGNPPPEATCKPLKPQEPEVCGDGIDNNCNGDIDENCDKDRCEDAVGFDPILIGTRSAKTTPFTDFGVEAVSRLSITRTYNSADASVVVGTPPGIFGRGWHHDWEATSPAMGTPAR
jgi:hypothetical protein